LLFQPHLALHTRHNTPLAVIQRHIGFILIYCLIALCYSFPTIVHLNDAITGQLDARENYWNLWWAYKALVELHQNPFKATWMYHPFGLALYFHTFNIFNGILSLPLQGCCGTAAAYNILNIAALLLAASSAYALVLIATRHRAAAFVSGLIYGFSPYMAFHLYYGQPFMLMLGWLPLYLSALLVGLRRAWWLFGAALVLAVIGLTDWHYFTFAVVMTGMLVINAVVERQSPRQLLALVAKLLSVGGGALLLLAPVLIPMVGELTKNDEYARRPIEHSILHSTDLLAYLLPSPFHPLWGGWAQNIFNGFNPENIIGGIASPGYLPVLLALCGLLVKRRESRYWALTGLAAFFLSLGPYLHINGNVTSIPLPYLVFRQLPFMDIPRFPSRFVAIVMLCLAVLAGFAVVWATEYLARRQWPALGIGVIIGLLAAVILGEYWPAPFPTTPIGKTAISPFFSALANDGHDYAIIEIPYMEHASLLAQTIHEKRTVGGRISRLKVHPWEKARFFGSLIQSTAFRKDIGADDGVTAWKAALACQNIRYVVFYKTPPPAQPALAAKMLQGAQAIEQLLFANTVPAYEDTTLRAYGPLTDTAHEAYWTRRASEWYGIDTNEQGVNYSWLKGDSGSLYVYPCTSHEVTLRFDAYSFAQPRTLMISLNGQNIKSISLPQEQVTPVAIPITLRDGENQVFLHSAEPPSSPKLRGFSNDERQLTINLSKVSIQNQ